MEMPTLGLNLSVVMILFVTKDEKTKKQQENKQISNENDIINIL